MNSLLLRVPQVWDTTVRLSLLVLPYDSRLESVFNPERGRYGQNLLLDDPPDQVADLRPTSWPAQLHRDPGGHHMICRAISLPDDCHPPSCHCSAAGILASTE